MMASARVIYLHCNTSWNWYFQKFAAALQTPGTKVELVEFHHGSKVEWIEGAFDGSVPGRRFGRPLQVRSPVRVFREFERLWHRVLRNGDRRQLRHYLAQGDITHFVAADPWALKFCVKAAARNHARVYYLPLEQYRHEPGGGEKRKQEVLRLEREFIPQANGTIVLGDSIAEQHLRLYGGKDRLHVVHNGWPLDMKPRRKALRQAAGLPSGQIVVLYTGFICPEKGVFDVVEAMAHLPDSVSFVIVGFGDTAEVEARARTAGVSDRVIILPAVPQKDLMDYIVDADIGVVPFRKETVHIFGCPGKLYEFMAAGLPLADSDTTDMRDLVSKHRLGEVFEAGQPADLARAVQTLAQSSEYRRQCAENSRLAHQNTFCWDLQSRKLASIILG